MRRTALLLTLLAVLFLLPSQGHSHCQIPCGIYGDSMVFNELHQHITTIDKSMRLIDSLSAQGDQNQNQLVRWVMNKEDHAQKFQTIISEYFLAQRIKVAESSDDVMYDQYVQKVVLCHQMIVSAMKCKQTVDHAHTEKLKTLLSEFQELYFADHGHSH